MVFTGQFLNEDDSIETVELTFISEIQIRSKNFIYTEIVENSEMWQDITNRKLFRFIILDDLKEHLEILDQDLRHKEIELEMEEGYINVIVKEDCFQYCWGQMIVHPYGLDVLGHKRNGIFCISAEFFKAYLRT